MGVSDTIFVTNAQKYILLSVLLSVNVLVDGVCQCVCSWEPLGSNQCQEILLKDCVRCVIANLPAFQLFQTAVVCAPTKVAQQLFRHKSFLMHCCDGLMWLPHCLNVFAQVLMLFQRQFSSKIRKNMTFYTYFWAITPSLSTVNRFDRL